MGPKIVATSFCFSTNGTDYVERLPGAVGQDRALSQVPASSPGPAVFETHSLVCPMGTISAVTGTRGNPPASCISLDKVLALVAITKVGGFEHYVDKAGQYLAGVTTCLWALPGARPWVCRD